MPVSRENAGVLPLRWSETNIGYADARFLAELRYQSPGMPEPAPPLSRFCAVACNRHGFKQGWKF